MQPQQGLDVPLPILLLLDPVTTALTVNQAQVVLNLGWQQVAQRHLHHAPPTPGELEEAINAIEDEVMRVHRQVPVGAQLLSRDPAVGALAVLAGAVEAAEMTVSVAAVERLFERLAAVALGRPAAQEGLPVDAAFFARALILRELLHHLQVAELVVRAR